MFVCLLEDGRKSLNFVNGMIKLNAVWVLLIFRKH